MSSQRERRKNGHTRAKSPPTGTKTDGQKENISLRRRPTQDFWSNALSSSSFLCSSTHTCECVRLSALHSKILFFFPRFGNKLKKPLEAATIAAAALKLLKKEKKTKVAAAAVAVATIAQVDGNQVIQLPFAVFFLLLRLLGEERARSKSKERA